METADDAAVALRARRDENLRARDELFLAETRDVTKVIVEFDPAVVE